MRSYKLYVPSAYQGQPLPLVVMLHGCSQDPDDFAVGTRMNACAEQQPCLVLYPSQTHSANGSRCWNWFMAGDQRRDQGEPSIIAGMTRQILDHYSVASSQIYVAGLSAGGAMALVMAITYPDLYAAVGVHSGLPYAVAHDLPTGLALMGPNGKSAPGRHSSQHGITQPVSAIVFHGDRDTTVHPHNADHVIAQCAPARRRVRENESDVSVRVERGQVARGYAYTRTRYADPYGIAMAEQWLIHGAGHAWSGGSARGSFTDPQGPDATAEMLRFFVARSRVRTSAG
jgi:poly(hydroxyalkanoate) depolymerase family esterase